MKKRLEALAVAFVFLALVFLVYRDVSANAIISFSSGGVGTENPKARAAVEKVCADNGGCAAIDLVASVPETDEVYEQIAYTVTTSSGSKVIVIVRLEAGRVVSVR